MMASEGILQYSAESVLSHRTTCFQLVDVCAVLCYDAAVCVGMETRSTPSETWSLWEERGAS